MGEYGWMVEKAYNVLWSALTIGLGYWLGAMSRRAEVAFKKADSSARLLALLAESIGDDDPRTYETDEQWQEILAGKADHDHIEVTLYAVTLKKILDEVRPGWELPPKEESDAH